MSAAGQMSIHVYCTHAYTHGGRGFRLIDGREPARPEARAVVVIFGTEKWSRG